MRRRCHAIWLAVAMSVAVAAPVPATMLLQRMPLEQVTREAGRIVRATVSEIATGRDEAGLPATWITLEVAQTLRGRTAARLTVKQYGVAEPLPDGTITRIAGLPRYKAGEEIVLFLRDESARGFTSPVGFGQGVYRVQRAPRVRPSVRRDLGGEGERDLDDFLAEVRRYVAQGR